MRSHSETWWTLPLVVIGYLVMTAWSLALVDPAIGVALLWLPSGFLAGCIVQQSRRVGAATVVTAAAASLVLGSLVTDLPTMQLARFEASNSAQAVLIALVIHRWAGGRDGIASFGQLVAFLLAGVAAVPAIGALLALGPPLAAAGAGTPRGAWTAWYASAVVGILVVTPLIVVLGREWRRRALTRSLSTWSPLAMAALAALLVAVALATRQPDSAAVEVILFASFPLLMWAAVRDGLPGAVTSGAVIVLTAVQLSAFGYGPFGASSVALYRTVLTVEAVVGMALVASLVTAVAVEQMRIRARTMNQFFDQPRSLHMLVRLDGTIERVSAGWAQAIGRGPAAMEGHNLLEFVHPDDVASTRDEMATLATGQTTFQFENRYAHRDGSWRLLDWSASADPVANRVFGVARDVTKERQAQARLRQAAAAFRGTSEGVVITDTDGRIVDVNDAFTTITGYGRDEAIGQTTRLLQSGRHDAAFYHEMWTRLEAEGEWRGEIWNRRKDGTVYPEILSISAVRDDADRLTGYVGVFADISTQKATEERLAYLAHHDPLTGLPNRLLLHTRLRDALDRARRTGQRVGVAYVDLDRFKHVNDSLGHPAGDALLSAAADRLVAQVGASDTVARLSGDEFVVVLDDAGSTDEIVSRIHAVLQAFRSPFRVSGQDVSTTVSIGISVFPDDAETAADLLRNADAAMYRAKDEGRNTFGFYTRDLTDAAFEQVFLENALRAALARDEFRLVYQPQVSLHDGSVSGVEALIRWHHPDQGVISPVRFIPVAEQNGLIRDIGAWVLRRACEDAVRWQDAGLSFGRVAVNVAGPQLQQGDFDETVRQVLGETGLPAHRLELEVTETLVMGEARHSVARLRSLRTLGVEVAIDDFGTGYSSLAYLKRLPVQKLKLDRAFVSGLPGSTDDAAIARAVVHLGHALDLRVLAEGIETPEQAEFLAELGCDDAQGFYFARPMDADGFEAFVRARGQRDTVS